MGWYLVYLKHSDGTEGAWQVRTWSRENAIQLCHTRYLGCWVEEVLFLGKE